MNGKIGDKILDETNFLLTLLRHKTIKVNMFSCVKFFYRIVLLVFYR